MTSENINSGSYATYDDYAILPYRCVKYLLNNDEVVWKLLFYNTPDAYSKANLTYAQKVSLIYKGGDNTADFRVFMDRGQPDVNTFEQCQIRIANYSIYPTNRVIGQISIIFEVYPHYKTNHLDIYQTRGDLIMERLLQTFNGASVPLDDEGSSSIGRFFFDRVGSESNRLEQGGQLPFLGKFAVMTTNSK